MLSLFRSLLIVLCLASAVIVSADDLSYSRLILLRGAIALKAGDPACLTDLQFAGAIFPEDWRTQLLYGEALALNGQTALAKSQLRRTALTIPWRPEPWQAMVRMGRASDDASYEYTALAGLARIFPDSPAVQARMPALCRATGQQAVAETLEARYIATLPPLELDETYTVDGRPATLQELRKRAATESENLSLQLALATAEWTDGNADAALIALRAAYQLAPTDNRIARNIVHLAMRTGRFDEAYQVLRALPVDDDSDLHQLALLAVATERYQEALLLYQRLLKQDPENPLLNRQYGTLNLLCGDVTVAVDALQTAWQHAPEHLTAQPYAAALLMNERAADAEALLQQAISLFPQETLLQVLLADVQMQSRQYEKAAALTATTARLRSDTVDLLTLAGERYAIAGKGNQVLEIARRLRDAYPSDLAAVHGAVNLFRRQYAVREATATLTRYLGPNMPTTIPRATVLMEIARFALTENYLIEAVSAMETLIKLEANNKEAYQFLGMLYQQQGRNDDAISLYRRAQAIWPGDADFLLAAGHAAVNTGDLMQAIDLLKRATALRNTSDAWLELGQLYQRIDDTATAQTCWQTAAALPAGKLRALAFLLTSYERGGDATRAEAVRQELAEAVPAERDARRTQWTAVLKSCGLDATDAEINALLLIAPDLIDPTTLRTLPQ